MTELLICSRSAGLQTFCAVIVLAGAALVSSVSFAQTGSASQGSDRTRTQREILAHLSGYSTPHSGSRSTAAERARTARFLEDAISRLGLAPLRHDYRLPNTNGFVDLLLSPYRGSNVYTVIEASVPTSEYVIVGAHYDTVPGSPGAIDNASGVALVYALADALSRLEDRSFNFILVFFDQEEDDEVGSRAFVRYLKQNAFKVHSVHIADLVGWDEDGDRAVEVQSPGPYLEVQYRQAADQLEIPIHVTHGSSSDNRSFLDAGYRTVGVWEEWDHDDSTPHVHRETDSYDTVDFGYLASTTELVLAVLSNLKRNEQ